MQKKILEFTNILRKSGIRVSTAETIDSFTALDMLSVDDREVFKDALRSTMTQRFEVQRTINSALRNNEFSLFLQPIFDMASGRAIAAECLVRWHHPTRGLVLPGQFIPVAEQSGLIVTLGRWILDEACRLAALVVSEHCDDFRIAVSPGALSVIVSPP